MKLVLLIKMEEVGGWIRFLAYISFKIIFNNESLFLHCIHILQSQSSSLTDDEVKDINASKNGIEKTIRAVYTQKKV